MALSIRNKLPVVAARFSRQMSHGPIFYHDQKELAGNRELVGHGKNGKYNYYDGHEMPFPAIRFSPEDAQSKALREKEKGDWKKLSIEEKKALYRHSFCQTFAEFQAPDPEWKAVLGYTLIGIGVAWGMYLGFSNILPQHPYREFYDSHEVRTAAVQRRLDQGVFRTMGFAPEWDLENRGWKK
uniref:Cytochrome c oxidase subunit 4 isoform 1, mitochondrial n=1 Tax=Anthurium amnicola TaxID=1678845 RepID=A0A1D1Z9C5_9ARAE